MTPDEARDYLGMSPATSTARPDMEGLDAAYAKATLPVASIADTGIALSALFDAYPALRAYIATIEAQQAAFEARLVSDEAVEAAMDAYQGDNRWSRWRAAILAAIAAAKVTA